MFKRLIPVLIVLNLLLVACEGAGGREGGRSANAGDPQRGKVLYEQTTIGASSAPGCATCHSREPGKILVGPTHGDIGARAATTIPEMSAEEFLFEAIVDPDAHVAEGFSPGIMYQNYGKDLTAQEINDLVAYMLTLNQ